MFSLSLGAMLCGIVFSCSGPVSSRHTIDLTGTWQFQIDRDDVGINQRWFEHILTSTINMPGSMPEQGVGDPVSVETKWTGEIIDQSWYSDPEYAPYRQPGHIKLPFWLQPQTVYVGAAWYQRSLTIPDNWLGKRIVLSLERPHWETRVWLDGHSLGLRNSLGTEHEYDLGEVSPGEHRLSIRVDNRLVVDVGSNSHSVSDHTQGNWNGIVGQIRLTGSDPVWIDDLQVFPSVDTHSFTVKGTIGNRTGLAGSGRLALNVTDAKESVVIVKSEPIEVHWTEQGGSFMSAFKFNGKSHLWNEFHPSLYKLSATLDSGVTRNVTFGMREITTKGTDFCINGQPTFFRGTLECAIFPKTGHPPTDLGSWKRIVRIAKSFGLNLIRFHSWCPPEAAFEAADELGFYYQVEVSSWGAPGEGSSLDEWLYNEADRMLRRYGNHPSFVLMPYGNEPGGSHSTSYLSKWVSHYKATDSRRLYTTASGWPEVEENQYHVSPGPRIQQWGEGLGSRINAQAPATTFDYREYIGARTVPVISHEIGQWCAYPDFSQIPKYTGYLKPHNLEIFRDFLNNHHMGDQSKAFVLASGKLQTICYKEEIESALRTPGMGGFELLDLHDFPGQGTALVGVLDPFWEPKGYVTAKEFHRFCGPTIPLARLPKRVFTSDETFSPAIEISHFGDRPLAHAHTYWKIVADSGRTMLSGSLASVNVPLGNSTGVGKIDIPLKDLAAPARYRLVIGIDKDGPENDWDFWVYPPAAQSKPTMDVQVCHTVEEAISATGKGGNVLLALKAAQVRNDSERPVVLGFSSIFWNTAWTQRQPPTTLGVLVDPKHPLFLEFPTEYHSNWQWWYLLKKAQPMILDGLNADVRPTVQVIDDWFTARRLGLVVEGKMGKGKIVICSIDLEAPEAADPVTHQFYLSLIHYMSSPRFLPKQPLTVKDLRGLVNDSGPV